MGSGSKDCMNMYGSSTESFHVNKLSSARFKNALIILRLGLAKHNNVELHVLWFYL